MSKKRKQIHSIIKNFCNGSITPDDIGKNTEKLLRILDSEIPESLYRYRKANKNNIDSFRNGDVFLSKPESFNDPTDCRLFFSREALLATQMTRNIPEGPEESVETALLKSVDAANIGIDVAERIPKSIRVACFSENILSPLMWSHYADDHKGFALRYNFQQTYIRECDNCSYRKTIGHPRIPLYPVVYKKKRTDMTGYLDLVIQIIKNQIIEDGTIPYPYLPLIEKGDDWKYEQEWRLICEVVDLEKMKVSPDALILGCKLEEKVREELVLIAKEKGIEVFDTYIDYEDSFFRMGIKAVDYDSVIMA